MTQRVPAYVLERDRRLMTQAQLDKKAELEAKGFTMQENQVVLSACRSKVAVPFVSGPKFGFLLPTGKLALAPRGKGVRLTADLEVAY